MPSALITGANRGLGLEFARQYLTDGWEIYASCRDPTSGMGSIGDNTSGGSIPYRSSKVAVNMVMRSLAIDLAARGITCVIVNPGWVRTDMGGPHATLNAHDSVSRLKGLFEKLGPAQSGKFFNHDGREYAW